jgi:hypothetical protein
VRRLDLGAEHADRAERCACGLAGAADRECEVADAERVELAERRRREGTAGHLEHRDIGTGVAADDLGVSLIEAAIGGGDADRGAIGSVEARADREVG